jgi:hypothetical protein
LLQTLVVVLVAKGGAGPEALPGIQLVGSLLHTALVGAIPIVGCVVVYHDLRRAREGLDTDALAAVFD